MANWWIKRPGRTKAYLKRLFGNAVFTRDGKIKMEYLRKALARLKTKTGKVKNPSLYRALLLALRIKKGEFRASK